MIFSSIRRRLERLVFGDIAKPGMHVRASLTSTPFSQTTTATFAISAVALIFGSLFLIAVAYYSTTSRRISELPEVKTFQGDEYKARFKFGDSPACGSIPCWADPRFDDSTWDTAILPTSILRSMRGYPGRNATMIYYRLSVPVDPRWRQLDETMAFSPTYIDHSRYEVFANGRSIGKGVARRKSTYSMSVDLPPEVLTGDTLTLVIKAAISEENTGFNHRGNFYIGPKAVLDDIRVLDERANITYYLLFALSIGCLLILLSFFFFLTRDRQALFPFLIFCFCAAAENIVRGSFFQDVMTSTVRIMLFFPLRATGIIFLALFFAEYLRAASMKALIKALALPVIGGMLVAAWLLATTTLIRGKYLFNINQGLLYTSLIAALAAGIIRLHRDRVVNRDSERRTATAHFIVVVSVYLCLNIVDTLFKSTTGFDRQPVFDLMFVYYIGFLTARRLGTSERRLKQQEEILAVRRAEGAIAQMTQMLAHDVRKPLSALKQLLAELKTTITEPKARDIVARYAKRFESASGQVDRMLLDVMQVSARRKPVLKALSLEHILTTLCQDPSVVNQGLKIDLRFRHRQVTVGESDGLRRAFANLLENASQAASKSGEIWIETRDTLINNRSYVQITIGNSGSYIPPGDRNHVFNLFFTKNKTGGTGLGLAVAKKIAEEHEGAVWCDSWEDKGTEFYVILPAAVGKEAKDPALIKLQDVRLTARKPHVIVLDDDPYITHAWVVALHEARVTAYPSAEAFLVDAEAGKLDISGIDLVICDQYFDEGQLTGVEFAPRARRLGIKRFVISSDAPLLGDCPTDIDAWLDKTALTFEQVWEKIKEPSKDTA